MNKILLGVLVVVVVGVGIYLAVSMGKNQEGEQSLNNIDNGQAVGSGGAYSINELLSKNKPMKCSWSEKSTSEREVTNVLYINGKKFYQDVTMGDMGHAYTISDGEYLYIWNDFSNVATKMKFSEMTTTGTPKQTQSNAGLDQERNFVCENWKVDSSLFNLPQGKNFKDVSEEMGQAMENFQQNSEEYGQQACDACRNAPSQDLVNQCLQSMQCN